MKILTTGAAVLVILVLVVAGATLASCSNDGSTTEPEASPTISPTTVVTPQPSPPTSTPSPAASPSASPQPTIILVQPTATPVPTPVFQLSPLAPTELRVLSILMSSQVDANGELVAPTTTFPIGTRQVRALVRLEGARPGMRVVGAWYQLGLPDSPPEGFYASSSETILNAGSISADGRTRVMFVLTIGGPGFSQETPWSLRVQVDGQPVATSGFTVVSP